MFTKFSLLYVYLDCQNDSIYLYDLHFRLLGRINCIVLISYDVQTIYPTNCYLLLLIITINNEIIMQIYISEVLRYNINHR